MLGRIVPRQKGPNESTSNFVLRSSCVADRAIWSNPNAADKAFAEAHQFFSSAGDGACVARRLVFAIFGQGGQAWRCAFDPEIFAHRVVQRQRADHGGGGFGEAEGLSQSRFRHEPAKAAGNGLPDWRELLKHSNAAGQPVYGAVVVPESIHAAGEL